MFVYNWPFENVFFGLISQWQNSNLIIETNDDQVFNMFQWVKDTNHQWACRSEKTVQPLCPLAPRDIMLRTTKRACGRVCPDKEVHLNEYLSHWCQHNVSCPQKWKNYSHNNIKSFEIWLPPTYFMINSIVRSIFISITLPLILQIWSQRVQMVVSGNK